MYCSTYIEKKKLDRQNLKRTVRSDARRWRVAAKRLVYYNPTRFIHNNKKESEKVEVDVEYDEELE